ncbi:MAG: glycosyltransferase family 2 protein [Desulfobacteraceae bacterium]|nr:MAG: glycosyltransferase family 2 protein [Desulfobacteraceae bacterium]
MAKLTYVLITPARNEVELIGNTIESVVAQSRLPAKWIIVSDGSTDGTDELVRRYSGRFGWIDLVRMPEHRDRQFAAKVQAFKAGCDALQETPYQVIGNLDADITFENDYFEYLIGKFDEDPALGVAGTPFVDDGVQYDYRFTNIEHVSGACQMFRRECFEQIGGYVPIKGGGIDWTAVTTARMKGWKTRTFTEKVCRHHRKMGTATAGAVTAWFRHGRKDYFLGGHPLWQFFRMLYQMKRRPYLLGGFCLFAGYAWAGLSRMERPVSKDLMAFHRTEQMNRLKGFWFRTKRQEENDDPKTRVHAKG